ncbi:DUF3043 domain-containing protein [Microbacterium betulae]|uniref:DUF3043 domain-containing protein n=1 Tax=Microbacterium betulae TaxID=2981139 RepID=A0AA97I5S4_9MICO|nr:DUF3043 domain-containing protein [Microbacterium sp. AB]WOF21825.1 DUF3043 domain-containing protein [Microbacterium sp. AB]
MVKTPSAENDASSTTPPTGKGRPTPTRAEREAANRRPLVPDTKEGRQAAKAELRARQERARVGMANGEEKYLPVRDKGPQKKFARDWTDAGWHLGEFLMPMMVLVIVATFIPTYVTQYWSFVVLWIFILFAVGDMVVLSNRVKRKVADKFGGKQNVEKGIGWYAAMRSVQMRFMRLPKAQVGRGQYPS